VKKLLVLLAIALLLSGCATLFTGTDANVKVTADPGTANAVIKTQGGQVVYDGAVPATVKLPKKNSYTVEITQAGYKTQTVFISQGVTGWFWGNLCLGGVVGMLIDWGTGGMWDLHPSQIDAKLAMAKVDGVDGPAVAFYTRDDEGQLRYVVVPLIKS
jgi:uncharacterized protein YceK